MRIFLGSPSDLIDTFYPDFARFFLDSPHVRRLLRRNGVEEAIVCGRRGGYALFAAYLDIASRDRREGRRLCAILDRADLTEFAADPRALWNETAARLLSGQLTAKGYLASDFPILCTQSLFDTRAISDIRAGDEDVRSIPDLGAVLALAGGEGCADVEAYLSLVAARLHAYRESGAKYAFLTLEDRFPAPLRGKAEEEREVFAALRRGGRGVSAMQKEAIQAKVLFALMAMLKERGMTLILCAGGVEWGDAVLPRPFDALSFAVFAEKAGDKMPHVLLLPRTLLTEMTLQPLCGVFPSMDGVPAVKILPRHALIEGRCPGAVRKMQK